MRLLPQIVVALARCGSYLVGGHARGGRMRKRRFVLRTVRKGQVRIGGLDFEIVPCNPQAIPYDGRLDGLRMAFGLYWVGGEWDSKYVDIWGTEAAYRATGEEYVEQHWPGPHCVEGKFPWMARVCGLRLEERA
jgi:hypothetical protein